MNATIEIITRANQSDTAWSGGTTTQLAIFPPEGRYADRSFAWRLSSATVNLEESRFTALPGFRRILMVLSGEMRLYHENHHEARLREFEQDRFDGAWTTTSFGRAVDFNLMMADGVEGHLVAIVLEPGEKKTVVAENRPAGRERRTIAFYAYRGEANVLLYNKVYRLAEKDILLYHDAPAALSSISSFVLESAGAARIIQAIVHYY